MAVYDNLYFQEENRLTPEEILKEWKESGFITRSEPRPLTTIDLKSVVYDILTVGAEPNDTIWSRTQSIVNEAISANGPVRFFHADMEYEIRRVNRTTHCIDTLAPDNLWALTETSNVRTGQFPLTPNECTHYNGKLLLLL